MNPSHSDSKIKMMTTQLNCFCPEFWMVLIWRKSSETFLSWRRKCKNRDDTLRSQTKTKSFCKRQGEGSGVEGREMKLKPESTRRRGFSGMRAARHDKGRVLWEVQVTQKTEQRGWTEEVKAVRMEFLASRLEVCGDELHRNTERARGAVGREDGRGLRGRRQQVENF